MIHIWLFLLLVCVISTISGAGSNTVPEPVNLIKDLTPAQVKQISVSLKIPTEDKLEETADILDKWKRSLEWLKTAGPRFKILDDNLVVDLALKEIGIQGKELKLIKKNYENSTSPSSSSVSIDVLEREAKEIIENYSKSKAEFTDEDVKKVKKWLLKCSLGAKCHNVPESLIPPKSTVSNAIEFLQNDRDLLTKLALGVKVYRWPNNLSVGHFIMDAEPKRDLPWAREEMLAKLQRIRTGIPAGSDQNLINEAAIRQKMVELFTEGEGNAILTPIEFRDRLKAVDFLVAVHLKDKYDHFALEPLTEDDKKMLKEWLLVHQMLYEVDGVSESGSFTIDWPIDFPLKEEYSLQNDSTTTKGIDYFTAKISDEKPPVVDADNVKEPKGVLFPALPAKLEGMKSSIFSFGSSKKEKEKSTTAAATTEVNKSTKSEVKKNTSFFGSWFSS